MKNCKNPQPLFTFPKMLLFFLFTSLALVARSQPLWLPDNPNNYVGLELLKTAYDNADDLSFLTSVHVLSGKFRLNDGLSLLAELPTSYIDGEFGDAEFALGNPYLGLIIRNSEKDHFFETGLRIPIAPDDKFSASTAGSFSDFDRAEAYLSDIFTITTKYNYMKKNDSNLILRFRGGPTFWISTSDDTETEVLLDYSAQAGYDAGSFEVLGGFTGRAIITESDIDFGERSIHQIGLSGHYKGEKVTPGLLFRFPMDEDLGDLLDLVIGIHVIANLN
ncbi:MAG: hypothetical protein AAFZ15_21880 [Bacteroidota bacterium]